MEVHHIKDFGVLREWEKNKFNFFSSWNRCSESKADIEELSCSGWKRLWLICSCAAQKWGEKLSKHGGGAHNSQNQLVRRAVHCTNVLPLSCPAFVRVSWIRTCNDKKQNAMHKTHRIVYWLYFDLNLFWEDFFNCDFVHSCLVAWRSRLKQCRFVQWFVDYCVVTSCIILCFFRLDLLLYLALVCASSVHWFRTLGGHKLQRCAHVSNVYPGLVQHRAQTSNVDIGLEILRLMANLDYQRENNGRLNRPKMQT